jgi:hypothetical protein
MQRIYVDSRLAGMSQVAAATAAGASEPRTECWRLEKNESVQAVMVDRMQKTADEVDFSRKEAHEMYMDAYRNADTAMEQVAAVNAMVKLHGLEKPKVLEIKHDHSHHGQLEFMPTDKLMELAGMVDGLVLEGEYEEVEAVPQLGPPEVTDDNTADTTKLPTVSQDY